MHCTASVAMPFSSVMYNDVQWLPPLVEVSDMEILAV